MSAIPPDPPEWFVIFQQSLKSNTEKLGELTDSVNFTMNNIKDLNDELREMNKLNNVLKEENAALRRENVMIRAELIDVKRSLENLELHSRRNNLVVEGIAEKKVGVESWYDCEVLISQHLSRCFGTVLTPRDIERAHRLGPKHAGKGPRPIIVKFSHFKVKDKIWSHKHLLKGCNIWITEDFPPRIRDCRKILMPYFLSARKREGVNNVKLNLDKLTIRGKDYSVDQLASIPTDLRPGDMANEMVATKESENVVVFASKKSIFSNLYECEFEIEEQVYNSTEQRIQTEKAKLFHDLESVEKIMQEKDSFRQMQLGKSVKNFKKKLWDTNAANIVKIANRAKYMQNEHAKAALLNTRNKRLGEATLHPTFGIGLRIGADDVINPEKWSRRNLMGNILEEIRKELQDAS